MFGYICGSLIRVTLAKRSNINFDLRYLSIVIVSLGLPYVVSIMISD